MAVENPFVRLWSDRKSEGVVSLRLAWQSTLAKLASAGLTELQAERLTVASYSPLALARLIDWISERTRDDVNPSERVAALLAYVEDSDAPLSAWIDGLDVMQQWLEARSRPADFLGALGYLECCEEAQRLAPRDQALPQIVAEMLDTYGYDGGR